MHRSIFGAIVLGYVLGALMMLLLIGLNKNKTVPVKRIIDAGYGHYSVNPETGMTYFELNECTAKRKE